MEHLVDPKPARTEIIRTPASGPDPANTLAFVRCTGSGGDVGISTSELARFEVEFKSKFKIDGFLQAKYDWYLQNTMVSATGVIRLMNTTTDLEFLFALDSCTPFIDLDGTLGFKCVVAMQIDGLGLFEKTAEIDFSYNVSAYVLLFEPRAELPPSGLQRQRWLFNPTMADINAGTSPKAWKLGESDSGLKLSVTRPSESAGRPTRNRDNCS
jgi:hypothetical protein